MFTYDYGWEQVGITSIGRGCGRANSPGIYTRVAAYQSWIITTMNSANQVLIISYTIFIPFIVLIL
jgi:secreted trypsin-like serine protease